MEFRSSFFLLYLGVSKYKARKAIFNGKTYDSKKEAQYAERFYNLLLEGEISELQEQIRFDIVVNGTKIGWYVCDFVICSNRGWEYYDVKGFRGGAAYSMFKYKKKLIKALYGIDIIEL